MSDYGMNKAAAPKTRQLPLWLMALHPHVLRVGVRDWLWRRRARRGAFGDYVVELGGQRFTQPQWEAVQTYADGPPCICPDQEIAARSGHISKCGTTA